MIVLSGWFVEKIHELHGLGFEDVHYAVDAGYKIVVGKQCDDAHDKAGHGCDESFIDASRKNVDIG